MPKLDSVHNFIFLTFLSTVVNGLKLDRVIIPKKMHIGDVAVLKCPFDLGKDRLYSVKWYKDNEEFFRYLPKYNPPGSEKAISGVKVQMKGSDASQVSVQLLNKNSTGIYKCQVSAEGPTFASVQREADVRVHPAADHEDNRKHYDRDDLDDDEDSLAVRHTGFPALYLCVAVNLFLLMVELPDLPRI